VLPRRSGLWIALGLMLIFIVAAMVNAASAGGAHGHVH
jgi:hypothetical protein